MWLSGEEAWSAALPVVQADVFLVISASVIGTKLKRGIFGLAQLYTPTYVGHCDIYYSECWGHTSVAVVEALSQYDPAGRQQPWVLGQYHIA